MRYPSSRRHPDAARVLPGEYGSDAAIILLQRLIDRSPGCLARLISTLLIEIQMPNMSVLPARYQDHPVWLSLSHYDIGPADVALSFAERLARENGWGGAYTARVLQEYRRFCYLAVTERGAMTPSDAVDQAWHLHLTYTRDYWERFCPDVLGRPLHHGPTAGGATELARYHEQYAQTLRSYERVFGQAAPTAVWPAAARRLIEDPRARRVHPRDAIVVPRKIALFVMVVTIAIGATAIAIVINP